VVGNDVFDAPWLDEGLTTYSSSLYFEFGPSPEFARGLVDYWQQHFERLKSEGKDDRIAQDLAYFESLGDPGVYSGVVYTKAALFFQALRQEIGDRAFFEALQQYYLARKYDIAAPADLLAAFEQAAGRKLDAFYDQWLYAPEK
jgi:aminopeptidase N